MEILASLHKIGDKRIKTNQNLKKYIYVVPVLPNESYLGQQSFT